MAQVLAKLANAATGDDISARIALIDMCITSVVMVGLVGVLLAFTRALGRRVIAKVRKVRRRRLIVPQVSTQREGAVAGETNNSATSVPDLDQYPPTLSRPSARLFARLPPDKAHTFAAQWVALYESQASVMVLGIQAAVRGSSSRRKFPLVAGSDGEIKSTGGKTTNHAPDNASRPEAQSAPSGTKSAATSLKKWRAAWSEADTDGSGTLSLDELRGVLRALGRGADAGTDLAEAMAHFDEDGSGSLVRYFPPQSM